MANRRAAMLQALSGGTSGSAVTPDPATTPDPVVPPAPDEPAKPPVAPAPEPQPDEAAAAAIRKQEIHARRQLAEERAQWQVEREREQAGLKPKLEEYEQWKQRLASAEDDPLPYLEAAGWTGDKLEQLARIAYAHSPAGAKDPRNKTVAAQTKAQRDLETKLSKMEEQIQTFQRQQAEQAEQARVQAQIDGYYSQLAKSVGDDDPIVRARIASMPDFAKQRMLTIAERLYVESGPTDDLRDVPDPKQVIKAFEKERRDELEADLRALGVDPAAVYQLAHTPAAGASAAPTASAPAPVNGAARPPSKTLSPNAGTPTEAPKSGRKSREELIKEMQRLSAIAKP
ncbi:MAG: hypothetical protein ACM3YM_06195 [Sphingomonadales bacterium]